MRSVSVLIGAVITLAIWAGTAASREQKPEELAQRSAEAWLALADAGKYAEMWDETASVFKQALTKEKWVNAMNRVRAPLGAMESRKLRGTKYTTHLPGAPDGEYVVIQYDTDFAKKKSAVETITPMLDKDGKWRVSGYFIK
jgi:hypothetical protein